MSQAAELLKRAFSFPKSFFQVFQPLWLLGLCALLSADLISKKLVTDSLDFNLHGGQIAHVTSLEHLRTRDAGRPQVNVLGDEGRLIKLRLVFNDRFIFGIGPTLPVFGFLLTLAATIFLVFYRFRVPDMGNSFAWLLVFSGAIGNLIDKAFLKSLVDRSWKFGLVPEDGYVQGVVDFVECIWFGWDSVQNIPLLNFLSMRTWPTFNVADSCIVVGVILLIFTIGDGKKPTVAQGKA
ncbi:MAG: signal peptidase II [Leptospirales bacterium]|nr:signal peptidase II [Leptospirales bacterium]